MGALRGRSTDLEERWKRITKGTQLTRGLKRSEHLKGRNKLPRAHEYSTKGPIQEFIKDTECTLEEARDARLSSEDEMNVRLAGHKVSTDPPLSA